ncbi:MAG: DUF1887 family protein [Desulfobulbaceae bacterium]|nr:DUF1887 family protein [Desulfobulbaceae bacterium]
MSEQQRICTQLLLLVGSNPLPNLLAALILKPESICLFYSRETEPVKDQLFEILKVTVGKERLNEKFIEDATDPSKVRRAFASISADAHLHYTGGTKIMASHARMAFREVGGKDEQASYLDERKAVLRFDDGYEIDITSQQFKLTMDEILGLHGIKITPTGVVRQSPSNKQDFPSDEDVKIIAEAVLDNPSLANRLYNINREAGEPRSFSDAKRCPVQIDNLFSGMTIKQLPENGWTKDTYKKWYKFLEGAWLEHWCRDLVQDIAKESEVYVSVNCIRANGRLFEIDVAFIRGHRLYVVSCTTDTSIHLCKSKLFEVAMRSRQLGGDLARSALVCLLHGSNNNGLYVDQLRNDIADIWDASNTPKVFGLDDLREWAGIHGEPNVGTLQQWLDS